MLVSNSCRWLSRSLSLCPAVAVRSPLRLLLALAVCCCVLCPPLPSRRRYAHKPNRSECSTDFLQHLLVSTTTPRMATPPDAAENVVSPAKAPVINAPQHRVTMGRQSQSPDPDDSQSDRDQRNGSHTSSTASAPSLAASDSTTNTTNTPSTTVSQPQSSQPPCQHAHARNSHPSPDTVASASASASLSDCSADGSVQLQSAGGKTNARGHVRVGMCLRCDSTRKNAVAVLTLLLNSWHGPYSSLHPLPKAPPCLRRPAPMFALCFNGPAVHRWRAQETRTTSSAGPS